MLWSPYELPRVPPYVKQEVEDGIRAQPFAMRVQRDIRPAKFRFHDPYSGAVYLLMSYEVSDTRLASADCSFQNVFFIES